MTYVSFRFLLIGLTAVSTGGTAAWIASRPSRGATRHGMRGLQRQRALLEPFWATIEPLVRWGGARVSGILSDKKYEQLDRQLTYAGDWRGITADEYFGMIVMSAIAFGLLGGGIAYVNPKQVFLVPILAMIGAFLPYNAVDKARVLRFREINRGLPYAIDLMSLAMSAGLDFPGATHQVVSRAKANHALRDELGYMLQQFQLGRTRAQALRQLADRVPIEAVYEFVQALIQAEERGTPVANALEIQAGIARIRRANIAETRAKDMHAKLVLPMIMLAGITLVLVAYPANKLVEQFTARGVR